jgi:hypothetical protein
MSMSKSLALLAVVAAPLGLVCSSCLNPQDDFNAYIARAADAQVPPSSVDTAEASVVDVAALRAPDASFMNGDYVVICVSQLAQDISQAFLLKASLTYTPGSSGGGALVYESQWLPAGATNTSNPQTEGSIGPLPAVKIDYTGAGTVTVGSDNIPAISNPIDGEEAVLSNLQLDFHIESPTHICAQLGAQILHPQPATLNVGENPCLIIPAAGGWSQLQTSDIHCP